MFVAVDRTAKFAHAELLPRAGKLAAAQFLAQPHRRGALAHPHRPHRQRHPVHEPQGGPPGPCEHIFDRVCREHGIEHRLTKVTHPWTNGQVERMNRTLKEATVEPLPLCNSPATKGAPL